MSEHLITELLCRLNLNGYSAEAFTQKSGQKFPRIE